MILMRNFPGNHLRMSMNAQCCSLNVKRSPAMRTAQSEPGEDRVREIVLKRGTFMGSGFAGGHKGWCLNWFHSRARRYLRMLENGTGESRGLFGPCFVGFYRGCRERTVCKFLPAASPLRSHSVMSSFWVGVLFLILSGWWFFSEGGFPHAEECLPLGLIEVGEAEVDVFEIVSHAIGACEAVPDGKDGGVIGVGFAGNL